MVLPISSMLSMSGMGSVSSIFAMYATVSAFINLIQNTLSNLVPYQIQNYIVSLIRRYFVSISTTTTLVIEARDGMSTNEVFAAAEVYLCSKIRRGVPNVARLKISKRRKETNLSIKFAQCEKILDSFDGIELQWRFFNEEAKTKSKSREIYDQETRNIVFDSDERYFELCFDKTFKDKVLDSYIPYLLESAIVIRAEKKAVKLHTLSIGSSFVWESISLEHPSTFETLAMMPGQKQSLIEDLDRFVRRKDFYRKVGRAWKRGYLLYGPPGTGKSSLIAAMANYLKFDIYDLDLTNVKRDSDLRSLLLRTANRSILVIEDIDCTVELPDRKTSVYDFDSLDGPIHHRQQQFTLSGLLNFIDGLWSSCGDERIIVFTTNHKHKLEPALLRPGRMDRHIHMSYLTPDGFRLLASTYLNVHEPHPRFAEIEELVAREKVTPAEIAEELMQSDDVDACLDAVVEFLKNSKDVRERRETDEETMMREKTMPLVMRENNRGVRERMRGIEWDEEEEVMRGMIYSIGGGC